MSLTAFFKENVVDPYEEVEFVVSDRFKEDGKAVAWKLRPMSPDKALKVTDESVVVISGKRSDLKTDIYFKKVVAATVTYPNLNNAELQDSYGVMSPEQLLDKMLNASEYNKLLEKCLAINGLNKNFEDKKDQVKN